MCPESDDLENSQQAFPQGPIRIHIRGFLDEFRRVHETMPDRRFVFVLGSGASKTSGIKTGGEMVREWLEQLFRMDPRHEGDFATEWATAKTLGIDGFDPTDPAKFYPQVYDRRFARDREAGYAYLEQAMKGAEPSFGYSVIAQILEHTRHKVIITTNFDNLVSDALSIYGRIQPLVCGHEALAEFAHPTSHRPLVIKIHNDILLNPKSSAKDVLTLSERYRGALRQVFERHTPIVIGYGGNDGSLSGFLEQLPAGTIPGGVYWCYPRDSPPPPSRIMDVVARQNGCLVPTLGFDELMLLLAKELDLPMQHEAMTQRAAMRVRRYEKHVNEIIARLKAAGQSNQDGIADESMRAALRWAARQQKPDATNLVHLEDDLKGLVVGQDDAISAVVRTLRRARSGLRDSNRPLGAFLFAGPTGVGKSYLCTQLARAVFGDETAVVSLDMGEFMEKHNASRLVGAPPGYVGYEEGGLLTSPIRTRPHTVVVLQEIEKAHPDAFNMIGQILEEGRLTDSLRGHVDFRSVILVMTSSLGSHQLRRGARLKPEHSVITSDQPGSNTDRATADIMLELERHLRPGFLGQCDEIVVFKSFSVDDLRKIVRVHLAQLAARLMEKGIGLAVDDLAVDILAVKGSSPDYGVRPMRRAIEQLLVDPIAERLVRHGEQVIEVVRVSAGSDADKTGRLLIDVKLVEQ